MHRSHWLISLVILLLTLWLKLHNLQALPVFVDEGTYLHWARLFAAGQASYPFLMEGRLLAVALLSAFDLAGPAPLWVSRAVVVILSLLNSAVCVAVGRRLGGVWAGHLAALFYAVLPYAIFHDRQTLTDPISTSFGSVALLALLGLTHARGWRWQAVLFGLSFTGAVLAKFHGLFYLAYVGWAVVLWPQRRQLLVRGGLALGFGVALGAVWLWALGPQIGNAGGGILSNAELSQMQCPPVLCSGDFAEQARRLPITAISLINTIPPYFGWPLVLLAILGGLIALYTRQRLGVWLALSLAVMLAAAFFSMRADFVARYVGFLAIGACVLAAYAIIFLLRQHGTLITLLVSSLVVLSLSHSFTLITEPARFALPPIDEVQYRLNVYSGTGFAELTRIVQQHSNDSPLLLMGTSWQTLSANAYLETRKLQALPAQEMTWPQLQEALQVGHAVYVIDEAPPDADPNASAVLGFITRLGEAKPLRLRQFSEANGALFDAAFPPPGGFLDQYDQILADTPSDVLLVAVPQHQAKLMVGHPNASGRSIVFLNNYWSQPELLQQLSQLTPTVQRVRGVFLDEARYDPQRSVENWLATNLFHENSRWYGPVRVVDWAVAQGAVVQSWNPQANFEPLGTLEKVEVLDSAPHPGQPLKVRLTFTASAPTATPYKIFVHFFQGEQIYAQHDGQPLADFRPTTGWQTGETITEQVALPIPVDLPAGEYQLRIGLYAADTQARLPATLPDGQRVEFLVLGPLTVAP